MLHAEGADLLAGGDAADGIRHVQPDALLPHHHRADVLRRSEFDEMVHRIAGEDLDAFALHDFRDGFADLHGHSSRCGPQGPIRVSGLPGTPVSDGSLTFGARGMQPVRQRRP
jgi:hypothetical protein